MPAHKVVMTTDFLSADDAAAEVFAGLDVEYVVAPSTSEAELIAATKGADALLVLEKQITAAVIRGLDKCKVISVLGVGVDRVDIPEATRRGIWVTNVPDGNYREVAVHTITLALALTRRLFPFNTSMHATGSAPHSLGARIRRPDAQTFGVVGFGRIGRRVAEMARSIGYNVITFDPIVSQEDARAAGVQRVEFEDLLHRSDVLSLHVPLIDATRNLIDEAALARLPHGAIVINCSRGGIIDENALHRAIAEGRLQGAGIDAYVGEPGPLTLDNPLVVNENILLTPHSAALSVEAIDEAVHKALDNIAAVLRGNAPTYPVNALT